MSRRHSQQPPKSTFVCTRCKDQECNKCVDILRVAIASLDPICHCKVPGHRGEPNEEQVLDPETGTVYAPGLTVNQDGEVNRL